MAITGSQFTKEFERRVDKSYNDYYAPSQYKDFFKRTLQGAILAKYNQLDNQRRFDELRGLLVYQRQVTATSGRIALQPTPIEAYDGVTGIITTSYPHNAQLGDTITVDIIGSSGLYQGDVVVVSVSEFTIEVSPVDVGVFESGSFTTPDTLSDYLHLFGVNVKYQVASNDDIEAIEATPQKIVISLSKRSNLRDGDMVYIDGVLGSTNANGVRYLNRVGIKKYQLYSDAKLEVPVIANGSYLGGGDIFNIYENKAFQIKPDMTTIQKVDAPTPQFPRFQIAENAIVLEPSEGIQTIKIDYIRTPAVSADPENDKTDLELYYSREFIDFWIDISARYFDLNTKDIQSLNIDNPQIQATI